MYLKKIVQSGYFHPIYLRSHFSKIGRKKAVPVPISAQGSLIEKLSRLDAHIKVAPGVDINQDMEVHHNSFSSPSLTRSPTMAFILSFGSTSAEGPLLWPGHGRDDIVSATLDRNILRTTRDLHAERAAADDIIRTLDLPASPEHPYRYTITDMGTALATIERLHSDVQIEVSGQKNVGKYLS